MLTGEIAEEYKQPRANHIFEVFSLFSCIFKTSLLSNNMGKATKKKASKTNWKKISHPDVDDFFIEEREKERHNFATESADNFLFTIDTQGKVEEEPSASDALVDLSRLKCFQILKPHSNVADPLIKRNKVNINAHKKVRKSFRAIKKQEPPPIVDPWDETNPKEKQIDDEWLYKDTARVNTRIKKKYIPHTTTELKAVELPHPGFSVNPTFGDHQDLLRSALDIETQAMRAEEKLNRATRIPKNAVKDDDPNQSVTPDDDTKPESDDDDDDKKPMIAKLKTKKQRRREKLLKESQQSASESKQAKVRESDVFNIKKFRQEIEKKEKKQKERLAKKVAKKVEATKFGQKPLSQWKFEQEKLNPLLSDELPGRLRDIKGGTSALLLDRFKSLQKRNIVEVRVKQRMKRKNKLIKYQRPCEKMEWEKTGNWDGIVIKR